MLETQLPCITVLIKEILSVYEDPRTIVTMTNDTRNVVDEFKDVAHETIVQTLDERGVELEIAIENNLRDFNMGTVVRNANAFGVRHVHIVGRRQWNKRGAMATDKYLHVHYHKTADEFITEMHEKGKTVIAIENNVASIALSKSTLPTNAVFVFGQEGTGLSQEFLAAVDTVVHIEQLGRSQET